MDVNGLMWLSMIIPVIGIIILKLGFNKKVAIREYALAFFVPVLIILISGWIAKTGIAYDTEYWNHTVNQVRYYEDWNEYIHRTCTESYPCGSDSKGNTRYCTRIYDCSYVDYHPEYWTKECTDGTTFRIDKTEYLRIARKFGTSRTFYDMKRNYHTNDGDMYFYSWAGDDPTLELAVSTHRYENRIQVSENTFKFPDVDTSLVRKYQLFEYPSVRDSKQQHYFGPLPEGMTKKQVEQKLAVMNARLCQKSGTTSKVKVFYLVFKNQPREAGIKQEWYWDGGNKNEFVVTIGVDNENNIQWCHPFSWTKNKMNQVETRSEIELMDSLSVDIFDSVYKTLDENWKRREFEEFNYLMIQATPGQMATILIITFLVTVGLMIFVIRNDVHGDGSTAYDRKWKNFHNRRF